MDENVLKQLYEVFELCERKGTGGMTFKYVKNEDVINRMNKVFAGNWETKTIDKDIVDDQVIVEVEVRVHDPLGDKTYAHIGFGSQQIMRYNSGPNAGKIIDIGNAYKGALAKGIVNACTRWGVGLFKERNPYEADNVTMVADNDSPGPVPVMAPAAAPASKPVATPKPPMQSATPAAAQPIAPTPMPTAAPTPLTSTAPTPPVPPTAVASPPAPKPVVESTTTAPSLPMPGQPVSTSLNITQETAVAPTPPLPNFAAPNTRPAPTTSVPQTPELPLSKNAPTGNLEAVGISDVQRVALNGILTMHKANYEELAREAFDSKGMAQPVPPKENLSYEEAVVVIKYGNDKFKKNR